jgi:phosphoserine phosphatase
VDLVIQSAAFASEAVDAFSAACLAPRCERRASAARLFDVPSDADTRKIAAALAAFWKCDAAFVPSALRVADFRLLVMDMDSTLITMEGVDELARLAGKWPEVAALTAAAMGNAGVEYSQSLRERVALLAGVDAGLLQRVIDERLRLSPGAAQLLAGARAHGWRTLLVSGGFTDFAEHVQKLLGIDEIWANSLVVSQGRLTGEVRGPSADEGRILDGAAKARLLHAACTRLACPPSAAIAVGDGANDLAMLGAAGLSVAYRGKAVVRERAKFALDFAGLDGILHLFSDDW